MRTFARLEGLDPGYDAEGMLTLRMSAPASRYPGADALRTFPEQVLERMASVPGVKAGTYAAGLPMANFP